MFSLSFSPQRQRSNTRLASANIENSKDLVITEANTIIKNFGYALNAATASDAQAEFVSNPDRINYTNNRITH